MADIDPSKINGFYHESVEGGIRYSPASLHSKEMARWETRPVSDGSVTQEMINAARRAGVHMGTFDHHEYPKAMVKAEQTPNGIKLVDLRQTAHDEVEERNFLSRGYRMTAADAIAVVEASNFAVAEAAANRAFNDKGMTAKAKREADAIDSSTARHLGEIPAEKVPPRKRGRKPTSASLETT